MNPGIPKSGLDPTWIPKQAVTIYIRLLVWLSWCWQCLTSGGWSTHIAYVPCCSFVCSMFKSFHYHHYICVPQKHFTDHPWSHDFRPNPHRCVAVFWVLDGVVEMSWGWGASLDFKHFGVGVWNHKNEKVRSTPCVCKNFLVVNSILLQYSEDETDETIYKLQIAHKSQSCSIFADRCDLAKVILGSPSTRGHGAGACDAIEVSWRRRDDTKGAAMCSFMWLLYNECVCFLLTLYFILDWKWSGLYVFTWTLLQ